MRMQAGSSAHRRQVQRDRAGGDGTAGIIADLHVDGIGRWVDDDRQHTRSERDIAGDRRGVAVERGENDVRGHDASCGQGLRGCAGSRGDGPSGEGKRPLSDDGAAPALREVVRSVRIEVQALTGQQDERCRTVDRRSCRGAGDRARP